jgi:acetyl esterase/lipase
LFGAVTRTPDVIYGNAIDEHGQATALTLDVYSPAADNNSSRPAIIWVHGGSFAGGDKTSSEIVDEATTFAMKGYVNVSINYRLSTTICPQWWTPGPACDGPMINAMHDAQAAVRFLRAHAGVYGVDPNRIAIGGSSAGAITALNVGFNPDNAGDSGSPGFSSAVGAAVSLSGAKLLGIPSAGDAPSLLLHNSTDFAVPYQWALDTVDSAHAAGLVAELTTWPEPGHVPYAGHRAEILDQTTNFLYWMLGLGSG